MPQTDQQRKLKKITKNLVNRYWMQFLIGLLLSGIATYFISNATVNRWQALWSGHDHANLPLCSMPMPELSSNQFPNQSLNQSQDRQRLAFKPIRLVVEPWRGEHNVYAVFAVPLTYYETYYRSLMQVEGTKKGWEATIADAKGMRLEAPEGHFLMVSFFPTRLSIWYWLTGKFANLQDPCNWTLYIYP